MDSDQCPDCRSEVLLRKGRLKVHHFAHKPPVTCVYGTGESETHRRCKLEIFKALQSRQEVTHLKLERGLGTIRPDISFRLAELRVAIEVQISALTIERITQRTEEYAKRNIALLWLAQWSNPLLKKLYSPRAWEKWAHAAHFGRVYYWKEGLTVIPFHFGECYLWKPHSEWYESGDTRYPNDGSWRKSEAVRHSVGGYWRQSKGSVTPIEGKQMNLLDDFRCTPRSAWEDGRFQVPAYKLWLDHCIRYWPRIPKPNNPPKNQMKAAISVGGRIKPSARSK